MSATGRRLQLLAIVQATPGVTAGDLARRFATTARTIRRDIAVLRDLGYRIDAAPGRHGGYVLASGSRPPLALDDDEAVAVGIGLRMLVGAGGTALADAAMTAMVKLEEGLPSGLRARLAAAGGVDTAVRRPAADVAPAVLTAVALACRAGESLRLRHHGRDRITARDVHPHRLVLVGRHWYLVAHDAAATGDGWRALRLDRIDRVQPTGIRRHPEPPADAVGFVAASIAVGAWPHVVVLRLPVDVDAARDLVDPTLGRVHPEPGGCRLEIGTDDLDWAARRVAALGLDVEVVGPPAFRAALDALGRHLVSLAGG